MTTVSTKSGRIIKVVSREEEKSTLTESDNEMDERAVEAVKAAINKAKICKKPIAGYDEKKKQACSCSFSRHNGSQLINRMWI